MNKYKDGILKNNRKIIELKNTIKEYYNKEVEIFPANIEDIEDKSRLKKILDKQRKDIMELYIIIDTSDQAVAIEMHRKIEELKSKEKDKEFSEFYRTGIICVKGIDVSVDRFYIKEVEHEGNTILNFICTDKRIDKKIFGTIEDRSYDVKKIYILKNSKTFYNMYLDKNLFSNNRITLDNEEKLLLFMKYIKKWKNDNHKMVAETMI